MKKFTCHYRKADGCRDDNFPEENFEAETAEEAAHMFAEKYPTEKPMLKIVVSWGLIGIKTLPNILTYVRRLQKEREAERRKRRAEEDARAKEQIAIQEKQLLDSLQKLHSSVERADGNLAGLSYIELSALVENLKEFPSVRDKIRPEECAVREELYKVAFFDRNLQAELQKEQAELQVELLRDLKSALTGLQSGKSGSGPGNSNLAAAAALGGMAALQKLNQIEENTEEVSEGFGFD